MLGKTFTLFLDAVGANIPVFLGHVFLMRLNGSISIPYIFPCTRERALGLDRCGVHFLVVVFNLIW